MTDKDLHPEWERLSCVQEANSTSLHLFMWYSVNSKTTFFSASCGGLWDFPPCISSDISQWNRVWNHFCFLTYVVVCPCWLMTGFIKKKRYISLKYILTVETQRVIFNVRCYGVLTAACVARLSSNRLLKPSHNYVRSMCAFNSLGIVFHTVKALVCKSLCNLVLAFPDNVTASFHTQAV